MTLTAATCPHNWLRRDHVALGHGVCGELLQQRQGAKTLPLGSVTYTGIVPQARGEVGSRSPPGPPADLVAASPNGLKFKCRLPFSFCFFTPWWRTFTDPSASLASSQTGSQLQYMFIKCRMIKEIKLNIQYVVLRFSFVSSEHTYVCTYAYTYTHAYFLFNQLFGV